MCRMFDNEITIVHIEGETQPGAVDDRAVKTQLTELDLKMTIISYVIKYQGCPRIILGNYFDDLSAFAYVDDVVPNHNQRKSNYMLLLFFVKPRLSFYDHSLLYCYPRVIKLLKRKRSRSK